MSAENLLRYNAMLLSIFELLADTRNQIATINAYATAQKNFWIADARLQAATSGALQVKQSTGQRHYASIISARRPPVSSGSDAEWLVAEPVVRKIAPGIKAHLWGYNGQSPGPTIEVVEGERVRISGRTRLCNAAQFLRYRSGQLHT